MGKLPDRRGSFTSWLNVRPKASAGFLQRFVEMQACQPNADRFEVICITQNIDTLLEKARVKEVWHLHGRIDYHKCEWH